MGAYTRSRIPPSQLYSEENAAFCFHRRFDIFNGSLIGNIVETNGAKKGIMEGNKVRIESDVVTGSHAKLLSKRWLLSGSFS